jgi:hypothetical protein
MIYKKNYNKKDNLMKRIINIINKNGFFYFLKKFLYVYIFPIYAFLFIKNRNINFNDKKITYFFHPYNHTWANERVIEIPLVLSFIQDVDKDDILEVGNVLSHYIKIGWDVLDKYETERGVINEDIINFRPLKKYKKIISISTMEHVGFDETPKNDKKFLKAILNLKKNCLNKNGKIILTIPIGWNPNLDNLLLKDKINFNEVYYFKRVGWDNKWAISNKEEVLKTKYSKPYIGANGIFLGVIKNDK